uniref:DUF834 domain-containing protein n=1 Tax=Oryza brachyantha TaxID=4533 RepID=J3MIW9_ORYBR
MWIRKRMARRGERGSKEGGKVPCRAMRMIRGTIRGLERLVVAFGVAAVGGQRPTTRVRPAASGYDGRNWGDGSQRRQGAWGRPSALGWEQAAKAEAVGSAGAASIGAPEVGIGVGAGASAGTGRSEWRRSALGGSRRQPSATRWGGSFHRRGGHVVRS